MTCLARRLDHYQEHGFVILRGVLDASEIESDTASPQADSQASDDADAFTCTERAAVVPSSGFFADISIASGIQVGNYLTDSPIKVPINDQFRIRVQTQDLGIGGSLVEAGIDEVTIFQPGAGCAGCPAPDGVGTILVSLSGDDVVLDWSEDPVSAPRYVVYLRSGPGLGTALRLGSSTTKSFTHAGGAAALGEDFYYEVTAVDACGQESPAP